jgi:hypothetical protein
VAAGLVHWVDEASGEPNQRMSVFFLVQYVNQYMDRYKYIYKYIYWFFGYI